MIDRDGYVRGERIDTPSHLEWIWRLPVDPRVPAQARLKQTIAFDLAGKWASAMLLRRASRADLEDPTPETT